jgi:hypothetical protein
LKAGFFSYGRVFCRENAVNDACIAVATETGCRSGEAGRPAHEIQASKHFWVENSRRTGYEFFVIQRIFLVLCICLEFKMAWWLRF